MTVISDVKPAERTETPFHTVGTSVTHDDFVQKVRGSLAYADDWSLPGMLFGRVVRAQVPSARITSIDVGEAARLPGVVAILTAADEVQIALIRIDRIAQARLDHAGRDAAPLRAANQRGDVSTVAVQIEQIRIEVANTEFH